MSAAAPTPAPFELATAYARCAEITNEQARNFAYGIRLLPTEKRQAMSALYAFARRVDDVGDGPLRAADKLDELAALRRALHEAATSEVCDDPVLFALGDAMRRFAISESALGELITGCEMDCRQQRYRTFEELVEYCRCVAGSVGRCSLAIFGSSSPEAAAGLADRLGIALQVTNILRDIVEDRDVMGRVYLPTDDLERFGCSPDVRGDRQALADLMRFEAARAEAAYADGFRLLPLLDRRSRACVGAMAGIYHRLLLRIKAQPLAPFGTRISLPAWEKSWVAARSLAGVSA